MPNISKYEKVYGELCLGCPNEKRCHEECEVCDKFYKEMETTRPYKKRNVRKFEELTKQEKERIVILAESGNYYQKEILEICKITALTYRKVMYESKYSL